MAFAAPRAKRAVAAFIRAAPFACPPPRFRLHCAARARGARRAREAAVSQTLDRCLGTPGILFLTLSVTTPASSAFVIAPGMLQVAGTGTLWALLIAGVVCVATAFIYAELSSAWPIAGGEYVMTAHTLGPMAAFAMLGVNVFNNLLFPPVAALGIADVAAAVLPGLPQVPVAMAVIAAATLLGVLNVRVNAVVTGVFLVVELLALAIVAGLGLMHPLRGVGAMLLHPVAPHAGGLAAASTASIGVATSIAIFAFNGYGAAVYFGEELHEASSRIARAVLVTLGVTLAAETLPIVAALAATPDLARFLAADNPFGGFVAARGGAALGGAVAIGVVVAIANAVLAGILQTARFFFSSAHDRSWGRPLDAWLAALHPRFASPHGATLLAGAVGVAACLVPLHRLLVLSGTGLIAIYVGITLAAIVGRARGISAHTRYRMPLYPFAPLVSLAVLAYVTWLNWLDPGDGRAGLIATAAQIAGSLLYYRAVLHRRGWRGTRAG